MAEHQDVRVTRKLVLEFLLNLPLALGTGNHTQK